MLWPPGSVASSLVDLAHDDAGTPSARRARATLQRDEIERVVSRLHAAQQTEADDRVVDPDAGRVRPGSPRSAGRPRRCAAATARRAAARSCRSSPGPLRAESWSADACRSRPVTSDDAGRAGHREPRAADEETAIADVAVGGPRRKPG